MRTAFRAIARTLGLTAVVVLSLGLGIGANTAVFTVINTVMLRDMPVREPAQLVEPRSLYPGDPPMNFFAWPSHFSGARTLSDVAGVGPARLNISYTATQAATGTVNGEYVTGNLFGMLGMPPALGRFIGPDDEADRAVVPLTLVTLPRLRSLLLQHYEHLG